MSAFLPGSGLILGGARSGKSGFAERLAHASGRRKIYIATSQIWDDEMETRVDIHRSRRGDDWELIEEPRYLTSAIEKAASAKTCVLVDCLTLWLTNLMMDDADIAAESGQLISALEALNAEASVLLVSNEVGHGIVPMDKMARDFRDHAGRLHQDIAAVAAHVWFVTAGLPQKLK